MLNPYYTCTYESEAFITAQLLSSLIRKNNITENTFLEKGYESRLLDSNKIESFRAIRERFDLQIEQATQFTNGIRKTERTKKYSKDLLSSLSYVHKRLAVDSFLERLKELTDTGSIMIRGVPFKAGPVPHWIDYVLDLLLKKHKLKLKDLKTLYSHIDRSGFDLIPTLDIRITLSAYIAVNNKREISNDQIDILRIASALPFVDVLLTDKARKFEIQETQLDKKYNTQVLSGSKEDLKTFKSILKNITL